MQVSLSHMTQKHIHDGIRKSERKTQREYELLQFFFLFFRVIHIFSIIVLLQLTVLVAIMHFDTSTVSNTTRHTERSFHWPVP